MYVRMYVQIYAIVIICICLYVELECLKIAENADSSSEDSPSSYGM